MQYIKQIVKAINDNISAKLDDARFQGSSYRGVALLANNDGKLMPLIADNYGELEWVGIDDNYPISAYHRTLSIAYADEPVKSYGDGGHTSKRETAQMTMIIFANRRAVKLTPEELEGAIISGFPSVLTPTTIAALSLKSCVIRPASSILDPATVYLAEYRTEKFELPPDTLLIRVNYIIESSYRNACFNICDC